MGISVAGPAARPKSLREIMKEKESNERDGPLVSRATFGSFFTGVSGCSNIFCGGSGYPPSTSVTDTEAL